MITRRAALAALLTFSAMRVRAQSDPEAELLRLINTHRAQGGLRALAPDPRLQQLAAAHAADLVRRDRLDHTNGAGEDLGARLAHVGFVWRMAAENVARGGADAAEVMALWLASDGHRRNLLLPAVDAAGIARAGTSERPFWVLIVAGAAGRGTIAPTR